MKLNDSQHTAIELLRIHVINQEYNTAKEVLELIEIILTTDEI